MINRHVLSGVALVALASSSAWSQGEKGSVNQYGNPMKIAPRPTAPEITERDLRTRLYQFADDSMAGRAAGTLGNQKGTDYIASELKRLGLEPAGDNGTYFQALPFGYRYASSASQLSAGGQQLRFGADFAPAAATEASFQNVQVIYGGIAGDTTQEISTALAVGRFVILSPNANAPSGNQFGRGGRGGGGGGGAAGAGRGGANGAPGAAGGRGGGGGGGGGRGGRGGAVALIPPTHFTGAVAVATIDLDEMPQAQRDALGKPPARSTNNGAAAPQMPGTPEPGQMLGAASAPVNLRISRAAAEQLMGVPLAGVQPGAAGKIASGRVVVVSQETPTYARNVVAILRGSDPVLKNEFVAIGAHNDHNPNAPRAVDHDSLHAYEISLYAQRMADGKTVVAADSAMQRKARESVNIAEIRKTMGPARMDSVNNGADDDGSGSMAVLEIAEALATAKQKPKRSVIFVWHTGEEVGLSGSSYFTQHPTVPIESIVAQINIDMIGRGRADDLPGGGPDYLAVVGSKNLSTELGTMVVDA
ncbi:MAG TPA: M28 family peptidase, partial [Gemmatimonadaceae bacterium]|nr:M28 family peptidase [Gemmatimonadaceae bacterium]